ncbi:MAG: GDP-mannose 4,6-dehydratase [Desulfosudis oleivorans]|nr:GDP-mannose 4,6-dehydratase [Desulfosudis oleivorans]
MTNRDLVDHVFVREKPDVVVHWAAESHVDRSILDAAPFIEANVRGTQVLLDVAKERGVGVFVNIATDEVYGELGEDGQFTEDSPLEPNSPYSVSKASADMLGRAYQRTFGLPRHHRQAVEQLRALAVSREAHPRRNPQGSQGERIPVYGKGLNVREWLYVSDCTEAVFRVIERGKAGDVFNVGSGEERRNIDVVTAILRLLNKPEDLIEFVKDRPGHDFRYSLSVEKIYGETGWRASVGFDEGISKTVSWHLDHMTLGRGEARLSQGLLGEGLQAVKYLIIGHKGQLGSEFVRTLSLQGASFAAADCDECDAGDLDAVLSLIGAAEPSTSSQCSACSQVDVAEERFDLALPDKRDRGQEPRLRSEKARRLPRPLQHRLCLRRDQGDGSLR